MATKDFSHRFLGNSLLSSRERLLEFSPPDTVAGDLKGKFELTIDVLEVLVCFETVIGINVPEMMTDAGLPEKDLLPEGNLRYNRYEFAQAM